MNENKLLEIKEEIDEVKTEINKLEGRQSNLMETLKEKYDCESVDEANTKIEDLETQIEELETEIEKGLEKVEEDYNQYSDE